MSNWPEDIYPESGSRLPLPKLEEMDDYGRKVFEKIIGPGSRSVMGLHGPAGINLHSPELAERETAVSNYLRYESGISGQVRELAILVTAREMDSQFEWSAHEPVALREGLSPKIIDIIRYRRQVTGLPETESVIIQFGREMFQKKVTSETFAQALKIFGTRQLVNLVALMAHYAGIAFKLLAFDMQVSPERKAKLNFP